MLVCPAAICSFEKCGPDPLRLILHRYDTWIDILVLDGDTTHESSRGLHELSGISLDDISFY